MKVPLLDLKAQYKSIKTDIDKAVAEVFESQYFINGRQVSECEEAIAAYSNTGYGVGVSSGTDALLICMMAENIGPGDEVITPDYSFFSTAGCISRLGAKPVFVDIKPDTFNIAPELIEANITPRTKAIIPVHLYGQMADMESILDIAREHDLIVIEDAAQAVGAEYKGKRAGSMGDYGCFSFFPSKNLGGAGDGGMVITNDSERAEKLKILRNHGAHPKYFHKLVGGNFRLDTLQAAVILVKLRYLDSWTESRQRNAAFYRGLFNNKRLLSNGVIALPVEVTDRHIYNQFVIRVERRDDLRRYLKGKEIGCEVYYPVPFNLQECFAYLGYKKGDFPQSESAAEQTLALPIYPELTTEQLEYVVDSIEEFYRMQESVGYFEGRRENPSEWK